MNRTQRLTVLIVYFLIAIISMQAATQYVAQELQYAPILAEKTFVIYHGEDFSIYSPTAFFTWFFNLREYTPEIFKKAKNIFYVGAVICFIVLVLARIFLYSRNKNVYGSARFADFNDVKKMGLLKGAGIFIGLLKGYFLRDNSEIHLMMIAGSRAGKGVGSIIPTSLTWRGSMIFTDIKGELWNVTGGTRKHRLNNYVFKFQPNSLESAHFNPLEEIRIRTPYEISDIDNLLNCLVNNQKSSKSSDMSFWNESALLVIKPVILYLLYTHQPASFSTVIDFLFGRSEYIWSTKTAAEQEALKEDKERYCNAHIKERLKFIRDHKFSKMDIRWFEEYYNDNSGYHPQIVKCCNDMIARDEKQFSGIIGSLAALLKVYQDPILAQNMADSDFRIVDLVDKDKPCSLYFVIPPAEIDRLAPVTNLILEMIFHRLTDESRLTYVDNRGVSCSKHRLLMMLDEFPSFGHLNIMEKVLSYCAQFKIKCYLIAQNEQQIKDVYAHTSSIYGNTDIKIYQTPNENTTAESISKALGKKTVTITTRHFGGAVFNIGGLSSTNEQETGRELMTVDELRAMSNDEEIIFIKGQPPIKCQKFKYYEQSQMIEMLSRPPVQSDSFYRQFPKITNEKEEKLSKTEFENIIKTNEAED